MQLSLKTCLWIFFAASMLFGAMFSLPDLVGIFFLTTPLMVAPALLVTGVVFTQGPKRALCIGSLTNLMVYLFFFWGSPLMMMMRGEYWSFGGGEAIAVKVTLGMGYLFVLIPGLCCYALVKRMERLAAAADEAATSDH